MSGRWQLALVAVAVALAVVLALVGVELHSVAAQTRSGDRALVHAAGGIAAKPHARGLGVRVAEAVLGIRDDRAYRDAFAIARASEAQTGGEVVTLRAQAEAILFDLLRTSDDGVLRSRAANLLGTLLFADARSVRGSPRSYLEQALGEFQDAVRFDPSNLAAKTNLEILATLPATTRFRPGPEVSSASSSQAVGGGY